MKTIHINNNRGLKRFVFPDNQPHVVIQDINKDDEVTVICSITDSTVLFQLLQTANAIENVNAKKTNLIIPYLMGARYDRLMLPGDSFDLKVIADLINNMQFDKVYLYDVHSEVSLELIHNSVNITNEALVKSYRKGNAILICPDKGAARKIGSYAGWTSSLVETVYCNKARDLNNGRISLQVMEPEKCTNRNCVIIDDLCDGGGTFLAIAQQIKPTHLTLIVTHGIFSKGFTELEKSFDQIIVSDSYQQDYNSPIVQVIPFKTTF